MSLTATLNSCWRCIIILFRSQVWTMMAITMRRTRCGTNPMASPGYVDGKFTFIWNKFPEQFNPLYSLVLRNAYNLNNNSTLNSGIRLTHKLDFSRKDSINGRLFLWQLFLNESVGQSYPYTGRYAPIPTERLNPIWVQMNNETPSTRNANVYNGKWRTWYAELSLNYNRTFGDHNIGALLTQTWKVKNVI